MTSEDDELISSFTFVLKDNSAYKVVSKRVYVLEIINYETYQPVG